jgi:methyl-accepting chemotaxis protein
MAVEFSMFDWFEKQAPIAVKLHSLAWAVVVCAAVGVAGSVLTWQELIPPSRLSRSAGALLLTALVMVAGAGHCRAFPGDDRPVRNAGAGRSRRAGRIHRKRRLHRPPRPRLRHAARPGAQARLRADQEELAAAILRDSLRQLASNRLDCQINRDLPERYEDLRRISTAPSMRWRSLCWRCAPAPIRC